MNKKVKQERIEELDREMQDLGRKIQRGREILSQWEREFTELWKKKEALERELVPVTKLPTRGKPRKKGGRKRSPQQREIDRLLALASQGEVNTVDLLHQLKKALAA